MRYANGNDTAIWRTHKGRASEGLNLQRTLMAENSTALKIARRYSILDLLPPDGS
jgi:hypothetical protein